MLKFYFLRLFSTTFVLILLHQITLAQFTVNTNIRNRFEVRNGYQKLVASDATPAAFMHQRTRITFGYDSEQVKIRITPQDVRIWGDESIASSSGVFDDESSLSMYEGYSEVKFGANNWVSVGRQELKYDNERLFSVRNWNYYGLVYDAAVLKLNFENGILHAGTSWNSMGASNSDNLYPTSRIKSLSYAWYNRKINEHLNLSLLHISSGVTETDSTNTLKFRHTTGFYSTYQNKDLKIWGNAYYQFGKNPKGINVNALLLDAEASYSMGKLTPGFGLSYLSGNSKTGSDQTTDHLFDLLYGARHKYNGFIDYFGNIPSSTKQGGLTDWYYFLNFNFNKEISINNTGHYFRLSQLNETTPLNKNLGYENDLIVRYKFNKWGTLDLGYLFIVPTESLKTMHGVSDNNFCQFLYLQLLISPKLF